MSIAAVVLLAATFTRPMERVSSLDPVFTRSIYDSHAVMLIYDTPLRIDYEARPYRLVPGVCKAHYKEIQKDLYEGYDKLFDKLSGLVK